MDFYSVQEDWEERAAIKEYCGNMSRSTAEWQAWRELSDAKKKIVAEKGGRPLDALRARGVEQ